VEVWVPRFLSVRPGQPSSRLLTMDLLHKAQVSEWWCLGSDSCVTATVGFVLLCVCMYLCVCVHACMHVCARACV